MASGASCTTTFGMRAGSGAKWAHTRSRSGNRPASRSAASCSASSTLAAALVRQGKQIDHDPACPPVRQLFAQAIEGSAVSLAREQSITVDQIEESHRLAPQGLDHVPIIDDLVVLAVWMRPPARQGNEMDAADEHVEAIVVEATRSRWPIRRDSTV